MDATHRPHTRENPKADRPALPTSYGILRATDGSGLLPWTWAEERLARARNYWIATTRPDHTPHVMPVWGLWLNGAFYFATDRSSRKGRNLVPNPHAVVHLESGDEVVILEGVMKEIAEASALRRFADAYAAKYDIKVGVTPAARRTTAIFAMRPSTAYAWLESDYPGSATRWQFE